MDVAAVVAMCAVEPEGVQEADSLSARFASSMRTAQDAFAEIIIIFIIIIIVIESSVITITACAAYGAGALSTCDGVLEHVETDRTCDQILHAVIDESRVISEIVRSEPF